MLTALTTLLDQEAALHEELLALVKRETDLLVQARPMDLEPVRREKELLLHRIGEVDRRRRQALARVDAAGSGEGRPATLRGLIAAAPAPEAGRLRSLQDRLKAATEGIRRINDRNRALIRHSLQMVRSSMALLNQLVGATGVYHRSGQVASSLRGGRVLSAQI